MALPIFVSAVLPIVLTLAGNESVIADVVLVVTWFVFVADAVVHARLVPGYLRSRAGMFDLGVVALTAPWFLIPGLGGAEFLAVARLARLARVVKASGSGLKRLAAQLGQVGIVTALLVLTCAYVTYGAERSVNKEFGSFGDALWWATVTITTVGYGDITPITRTGRVTAAVLMFAGLAVLGVLAGALASFFGFGAAGRAPDGDEATTDMTARTADAVGTSDAGSSRDVEALRERLDDLDRAIAAVREELR